MFDKSKSFLLRYIVKSKPKVTNLTKVTNDPVAAYYIAPSKHRLIEVRLEKLRLFNFLALRVDNQEGVHPFIDTLRLYEDDPSVPLDKTPLWKYYQNFQPSSPADIYGLEKNKTSNYLSSYNVLSTVYPWDSTSPHDQLQQRKSKIESCHTNHGIKNIANTEDFRWGPVSFEKAKFEFKRLLAIYSSIKQNGYRRSDAPDGDIVGRLYRRNSEWSIEVIGGQHRLAALSALGAKVCKVRILASKSIVMHQDVQSWPNVINNIFSHEESTRIFERFLYGNTYKDLMENESFS